MCVLRERVRINLFDFASPARDENAGPYVPAFLKYEDPALGQDRGKRRREVLVLTQLSPPPRHCSVASELPKMTPTW